MEHFLNLNYIQAIHNLEIMEERQDDVDTIRFHEPENPFDSTLN